MSETVLQRMMAAGISEDSARDHFVAGQVHVNGEQVVDPDSHAEGSITLREPSA